MQKNGIIGFVVLLFACTFLSVIYFLGSNGHSFEKVVPGAAAKHHAVEVAHRAKATNDVPGDNAEGVPAGNSTPESVNNGGPKENPQATSSPAPGGAEKPANTGTPSADGQTAPVATATP